MADYNFKQCKTFLRLLSKEDRSDILSKSTNREFKKGEQIVRVMDRDTNLYLINTGSVRVTLYSNEGKEVSFVDIDAGGNFGEFSAIDGKPRSANVIALSDTTITVVPPREFIRMLEKYPEVCVEILQQLTGIVRRLCDRIFEYSTLDVSDRVHAELLRLAKKNLDYDGIARVHNPPTQSEFASRVSCTREAVSRELKKLEKSGVIKREPKRLIIEDCKKLQELVDEVLGG
jgi:CRP-like cAMP-binding protein